MWTEKSEPTMKEILIHGITPDIPQTDPRGFGPCIRLSPMTYGVKTIGGNFARKIT